MLLQTLEAAHEEINRLRGLLSQMCIPSDQLPGFFEFCDHLKTQPFQEVTVGKYPGVDKADVARWMSESAHKSTETTLWMVLIAAESDPPVEGPDGQTHIEHAVTTMMTGNGPRSEYHAYLYAYLHNAAPFIAEHLQRIHQAAEAATEDYHARPETI